MGRERKCILCQTVYSSKQEMDDHMRSMLHHRELENLKGRDCGHECRACGVTVLSLTDYASHISSPGHKQRVEAHDRRHAGKDQEEEYFDQELVKLIMRRKELNRLEELASKRAKEFAASKLAIEEAKRKKEEEEEERRRKMQQLQQRWDQTKQYVRQKGGWPQKNCPGTAVQAWGGAGWEGSSTVAGRAWGSQEDPRTWHQQSRQGKSATWHAQEPPDYQTWDGGERSSGSLHSRPGWSGSRKLGSSTMEPDHMMDFTSDQLSPWNSYQNFEVQNQARKEDLEWRQSRPQSREGPGLERKNFGSNPKLDKSCRWSPYPTLKIREPSPHGDAHPSPSEKLPRGAAAPCEDGDPATDAHAASRLSRWDQKTRQRPEGSQRSSSNSSAQRDSSTSSTTRSSLSSRPKPAKPGAQRPEKKQASASSSNSSSRSSSQNPTHRQPSAPSGPQPSALGEKEEQELAEMLRRAKETLLDRPSGRGAWTKRHNEEKQEKTQVRGGGARKKSTGHRQDGANPPARPAPVTPALVTPALVTPAPITPAPILPALVTPALVTPALVTPAPITPAPITPAPVLPAPVLPAPITPAPVLPAPVLPAPVTPAPVTPAPVLPAPVLPAPVSPAPVRCSLRGGGKKHPKFWRPVVNSQSVQSVQVSTSSMEAPGREEEEYRERGEEEGGLAAVREPVDTGPGSDSDVCKSREAQTTSCAASLKAGIPPSLKRDLTKHISTKPKGGACEPNLNIARRIRSVSGARRAEAEKDSGLKPTVRQLISSSGSRRNVNWEQVYLEVCRKKQQQGKGQPRFGIEMVSCDQEGMSQEEEDIPLTEGFQWESLLIGHANMAPTRQRSLSESSVAPESSLFPGLEERAARKSQLRPSRRSSPTTISTLTPTPFTALAPTLTATPADWEVKVKQQPEEEEEETDLQNEARPQTDLQEPVGVPQAPDSMVGYSSLSTEPSEAPGSGKKRRAAGDVPSPEIPSLERKNKRRKTKSKKERLQVDQLLVVSLREEQLSRDLQAVDDSLLQARAALQQAYLEVQSLMVLKQKVTMEMSTLRSKRIELLQGMQGEFDSSSPELLGKALDEEMALAPADPQIPALLSPMTDAAVPHPSPQPPQARPSSAPNLPVVVKQESPSPHKGATQLDPEESTVPHGAHSTTPEPTISPPGPGLSSQSSQPSVRRLSGGSWDGRASLPGMKVQSVERAVQTSRPLPSPETKPFPGPPLPCRRGSQPGAPEPAAPPPPEPKTGKRVRKLKKKRVLRQAQGPEQGQNSDTELEGESSSRPHRRLRQRRRPGGAQVSTSTSTTMEGAEDASGPQSPATKPGKGDSDSSLEMVEIPQAPLEVVTLDTSDPEDSGMDVTPASPQPQFPASPQPQTPASPQPQSPASPQPHTPVSPQSQTPASPKPQAPALAPAPAPSMLKSEPEKLACNEVSSTSEMEVSSISELKVLLPFLKMPKTSSAEVSSDAGEEEVPSEGVFEGHHEAVNALQIHDGLLYTCSGDRTVRAFNLVSRKCVAVLEGHSSKVNCLLVSSGPGLPHRLYSGSSDQTIRCYSLKTRECVEQFSLPDRVLCLISKWKILYAGLANGCVVSFSLKTNRQLDVFECHGPRAVSCLATAQEGARRILLVGSYDSTISVRDAKSGLMLRSLEGHSKTVLCMKVANDLVFSGSSDQTVHAHNIHTGQLVRIYKGHSHAVTVVTVLGKVMVTACLDKLVHVYELQSHERLQVYGGHSDMVMCMSIHKSMIYTGCYNGSVQATRLNLMRNHRCLWHGCSLVFGVKQHLQQHLLSDHAPPSLPMLKCHWRNCDEFFSTRNASKQSVPKHMQHHVDEAQLES
ncbi:zinc finger protein 106 [Hypomesus transpacificus]|uniref:zinc finger protein 106 n=1 Tax=Hypomesus transpacificus TaxID=137520 RepID=UPI001F084F1B|nr:zinc finger protein 106 [Hypomesus transpacificus]XP_046871099.1 zinc finger protein 106 [Hypomesus transpacificus]